MHAFRSSSRRLRQLVWLTLLAWSFALASGVVNACLLIVAGPIIDGSPPPVHGEAATQGRPDDVAVGLHSAAGGEAGVANLVQYEHQQGSSGKDTCLKFCDDESSAVVKSTSLGVDLAMAMALVESGVRRMAAPVENIGADWLPEQPRAQGPPLVIRFLRLTL
jgi:hypothetical protein